MKPTGTHPIIVCVILGILTACTPSGPALSQTSSPTTAVIQNRSQQMRASDRMLYWEEEARELHEMATRREREAELMWKKFPGPEMAQFKQHMRLLAHQLQEAAEYAGSQAKEAEREMLPDAIRQLHSALDDSVKADMKEIDAAPAAGGASHGISADR